MYITSLHKLFKRLAVSLQTVGRFLCLCILLFMVSGLYAQPRNPLSATPPGSTRAAKGIGPAQAVKIAKQRHGGKVLKVSREGAMYRVKLLLPSGKVKVVYIDAGG